MKSNDLNVFHVINSIYTLWRIYFIWLSVLVIYVTGETIVLLLKEYVKIQSYEYNLYLLSCIALFTNALEDWLFDWFFSI